LEVTDRSAPPYYFFEFHELFLQLKNVAPAGETLHQIRFTTILFTRWRCSAEAYPDRSRADNRFDERGERQRANP